MGSYRYDRLRTTPILSMIPVVAQSSLPGHPVWIAVICPEKSQTTCRYMDEKGDIFVDPVIKECPKRNGVIGLIRRARNGDSKIKGIKEEYEGGKVNREKGPPLEDSKNGTNNYQKQVRQGCKLTDLKGSMPHKNAYEI